VTGAHVKAALEPHLREKRGLLVASTLAANAGTPASVSRARISALRHQVRPGCIPRQHLSRQNARLWGSGHTPSCALASDPHLLLLCLWVYGVRSHVVSTPPSPVLRHLSKASIKSAALKDVMSSSDAERRRAAAAAALRDMRAKGVKRIHLHLITH
jgi:hypothetical protein